MKIEIRIARPLKNAGSSASMTPTTLPSAGATISRPSLVHTRSGSRKKATTQSASNVQSVAPAIHAGVPSRPAARIRTTATTHVPTMNQRPSGAVRITPGPRAPGP